MTSPRNNQGRSGECEDSGIDGQANRPNQMATNGMEKLALKESALEQEWVTKGNKDDSEDGQQNLPWPFNVAPTSQ